MCGSTVFPPKPQASLSRELSPATELLLRNEIKKKQLKKLPLQALEILLLALTIVSSSKSLSAIIH